MQSIMLDEAQINIDQQQLNSNRTKRIISKSPFPHKNTIFTLTGDYNQSIPCLESFQNTIQKQTKASERSLYSSLVVHKEPDIQLKVQLGYRDPLESLDKKLKNHQKIDILKSNLERKSEIERQKYLEKMKKLKEKEIKVKENIEYEEFVRKSKIDKHTKKLQQAQQVKLQQQKELEIKALNKYKEDLSNMKQKGLQELFKETNFEQQPHIKRSQTRQQSPLQKRLQKELEQDKLALSIQEALEQKLLQGNQRFQQKIDEIIQSRNDYIQKVQEMRSKYQEQTKQQALSMMKKSYDKVSYQQQKFSRVKETIRQQQEFLHCHINEKFRKKNQLQEEISKQRQRWNSSVVHKHQKHQIQVKLRNSALLEEIEAMKEYKRLKREDILQNLNLTFEEQELKRSIIYSKHQSLDQKLKKQKEKLDQVQENSRIFELKKRQQFFEKSQSIKYRKPIFELEKQRDLSQSVISHQSKPILPNENTFEQ